MIDAGMKEVSCPRLSQHGGALVSVMVGAVVGLIVALSMASMLHTMQLSANNLKFRSDADAFLEEMRAHLSAPVSCENSFRGLLIGVGSKHDIEKIYDSTPSPGKVLFATGSLIRGVFVLSQIQLLDYRPAGSSVGEVMLRLDLDSSRVSGGAQVLSRTLQVRVDLGADGRLVSCIALAKMSDGIWRRTGANLQDIFFSGSPSGGSVGIGLSNPTAMFEVAGEARIGSSTKLCAANMGGAVRYNSSMKLMEYCDETSWRPIVAARAESSGLDCSIEEARRAGGGRVVAECASDRRVTGCSGNCRGTTIDGDISVSGNACILDDSLCTGSSPLIEVSAICCKIVPK